MQIFRVFVPFHAYLEYLRRNGIAFKTVKENGYEYIEFSAKDRFNAKEDYVGLAAMCGYIVDIAEDGKETVLRAF